MAPYLKLGPSGFGAHWVWLCNSSRASGNRRRICSTNRGDSGQAPLLREGSGEGHHEPEVGARWVPRRGTCVCSFGGQGERALQLETLI